jgi:hypothetical protein
LLLESTLAEAEAIYRQLYERIAPMMRFLTDLHIPSPKAFYAAAEFVLNSNLRCAFESEKLDSERIQTLLEEVRLDGITLDVETLEYTLRMRIERMAELLFANPTNLPLMEGLRASLDLTRSLPFSVNLWKSQNAYYKILQTIYPEILKQAERGDESARVWKSNFTSLGEMLSIRVR